MNQLKDRVLNCGSDQLVELKDKYEVKIFETEQIITDFTIVIQNSDLRSEREDKSAACGIMRADIKKRRRWLFYIKKAIVSKSRKDAEAVMRNISEPTNSELEDWKLNEKFHKQKNVKALTNTAVNLSEIARFILLTLAVTLSLVGIGVNLIPALIAAGIIGNIVHFTCIFLNNKADKEMNSIRKNWCADPIPLPA